ncbi:MAG: ATP-dependent zinc metalloprotease FtsH [Acetomicrobium sp.]|uniref:ATP-dependent zinc metalloprotease FtsH n=1 Tax=Acetomicrobium TaxID=49894 RepID=UPI001690DD01|nr:MULTISPECIES: ATP-dependent zinc metalloprotease FtsH [Acetomicrobium]MDI9376638.1 ATP-dependent zinc metalloprotease FtsH [Synergistota bacterium]NLI43184.1 ATP-dependent metallopeptidase FtsH/Yme1/Tma family protein [Synergistaceae bacterium]MDR9770802.1 ATP-dependent zinc metalloprotease FtsH [Acetomicrobium sp.]HOB10926.1 ATP-dependent zinc metalloprotease FtsH [Acetomicrobium sp.]HQA35898.1 ATP-dependent zinc metalloprotease FtsH [Acetomicrobium sp.]
MGKMMKNLGLYLILIVLVVSLVNMFMAPMQPSHDVTPLSYSEFLNQVDKGNVAEVTVDGSNITGRLKDGRHFNTYAVGIGDLAKEIAKKGVNVEVKPPQVTPWWSGMVSSLFPTLLLIGAWIFILYHMQGGGSKVMSFAKSKAKMFLDNRPKVTFDDVAGCDEAKEELQEVIEFLRNPRKFTALGARVPRGVLLLGPPGTGKTLLARAVAGEADVPFFSISGSDFVEMFVGVGAARVRDLFEQARKYQPCIIFIDEIDAVGRHRGAGLGGGHDEREQTLNQLLVELDGFDASTGIIVLAATNRPDILDPALLRPGRFDRQVVVDRPDSKGRLAILKVHVRDKKVDPNVDLEIIAKRTPGFVGADLANLVNEAALLAARRNKKLITMEEFEEAIDRVIAGPERKSRVISPKEKRIIALHESGHALVAKLLPDCDPVHKVSIIPRGHQALGYTMQLPEEDRFLISKKELLNRICVLLGGRVTEELKGDDITTGAQNDLERATQIARKMVTEFGMSDRLGPIRLGRKQHEIFLGRDIVEDRNYSEEIAYAIDQEVRRIIDNCYETVKDLLIKHESVLEKIAEVLLEKEVLEGEELDILINHALQRDPEVKSEEAEEQSVAASQAIDKKAPVQWEPRVDPA